MARYNLTIDHTKVSATLTNFPVYVNLDDVISGITSTQANSTRVYKADGTTELPREIVSTTEMHFKADSVSSSSDTVFVLDINGTSSDYSATDTYGRNAVWTSYVSVHHLDEASGNFVDSTGSGNDGTITGTITRGVSAQLGDGISVSSGAQNTIDVPNVALSGDVTVTLWAAPSTSPGNAAILFEQSGGRYRLFTTGNSSFGWRVYKTSGTLAGLTATDGSGGSHHWAVRTKSGDGAYAYVDGAQTATSTTVDSIMSTSSGFHIGGTGNSTQNVNAVISEVRAANSDLGSDWIATEYANQNSPSTFYSVSSASVQVTTTQSGKGRIAKIFTKTQSGKGRTSSVKTNTQSGKGSIGMVFSADYYHVDFVTGFTKTNNQMAIARIQEILTNTQSGKGRVTESLSSTQTGKARLSKSITKTQSAVAHLVSEVDLGQTAVARIVKVVSLTQTAKARISDTFTLTQSSVARISKLLTDTQTSVARVFKVGATKTQTSTARVTEDMQKAQTALGRISKLFTRGQASTGRVATLPTDTQDSKARISVTVSSVQLGEGRIVATVVTYQPSKARVRGQPNYTPIGIVIQSQSRKGEVGETKTVATVLSNGTMSAVSSKTKKYEVEGQETDVIVQSKSNKGTL